MSTTYTWTIDNVDCVPEANGLINIISAVHWRLTASDGVNTGEVYGKVLLDFPDSDSFTSFDSLTEDQIVAFLHSAMTTNEITKQLAVADYELNKSKEHLAKSVPLPWQ